MKDESIWITKRDYSLVVSEFEEKLKTLRSSTDIKLLAELKKVSEGGVIHIV